jgi:hypothetical protein
MATLTLVIMWRKTLIATIVTQKNHLTAFFVNRQQSGAISPAYPLNMLFIVGSAMAWRGVGVCPRGRTFDSGIAFFIILLQRKCKYSVSGVGPAWWRLSAGRVRKSVHATAAACVWVAAGRRTPLSKK